MGRRQRAKVPALRVRQWLASWENLEYDEKVRRRKPEPHFYLAAVPAGKLRALAGIYRRDDTAGHSRQWELGIQRTHDRERSDEISEYVRNGFPWSELSRSKRESGNYDDLRKPGWLPTAIVVNVLRKGEERQRQRLAAADAIEITDGEGPFAELKLPAGLDEEWETDSIPPIEVIDGQHRLWAFDPDDEREFDLPVVAFHGLDISWQAYLFYSINITPKKINRSLAYDLYPLLRSEDWLERFEGAPVYRESRAQELTEALWAIPESPWYDRINMLGRRGVGGVTQAAWIRSLMATFVRAYEGRGVRGIGGLFGARAGEDELALDWSAAQQAAFLIMFWTELFDAILENEPEWARDLALDSAAEEGEEVDEDEIGLEVAIKGPDTLLNSDQGVRGALHVVNDLLYVQAEELGLQDWVGGNLAGIGERAVLEELEDLEELEIARHLRGIAHTLSAYDWRSSNAPGLSSRQRKLKARFRGSGGYKELRRELTEFLVEKGRNGVAEPAEEVFELLGFDE